MTPLSSHRIAIVLALGSVATATLHSTAGEAAPRTALLGGLALHPVTAAGETSACTKAGYKTVLAWRYGRVVQVRARTDSARRREACLFRTGRFLALDQPDTASPAWDVAGRQIVASGNLLAYFFESHEGLEDFTGIHVVDLRTGRFVRGYPAAAFKEADYPAITTDLVLRRDGASAWIACEPAESPPYRRARCGRDCDAAGTCESTYEVLAVDSRGRRRRLGRSSRLVADSIALTGGEVTWRKRGETELRRAQLP